MINTDKNCVGSDRIYQYIIQGIAEGRLKPADRIKEQDLVEQTGLSRTPIREALTILLNEGILTQDNKNRLSVTSLDLHTISKLYEMRELLEGEAARLAVEHASNSELEILAQIVQVQKTLTDITDIRANNVLFHQTLYHYSCNNYLLRIMQNLDRSLILLGESTLIDTTRQKQAHEEHLQIVQALQERDEKKASLRAKFHIQQAYKLRLSRILKG